MGRGRTKTVKRAAKVLLQSYYQKLTTDFHINKRILSKVAKVPTKKLRNKISGFATHLLKRIQKGPVKGISLKVQEQERQRRLDWVPRESEIRIDKVNKDNQPAKMLKVRLGEQFLGKVENNLQVKLNETGKRQRRDKRQKKDRVQRHNKEKDNKKMLNKKDKIIKRRQKGRDRQGDKVEEEIDKVKNNIQNKLIQQDMNHMLVNYDQQYLLTTSIQSQKEIPLVNFLGQIKVFFLIYYALSEANFLYLRFKSFLQNSYYNSSSSFIVVVISYFYDFGNIDIIINEYDQVERNIEVNIIDYYIYIHFLHILMQLS